MSGGVRLALLVGEAPLRWQCELAEALRLGGAEPVALLLDPAKPTSSLSPPLRLYRRLDHALFSRLSSLPDPFRPAAPPPGWEPRPLGAAALDGLAPELLLDLRDAAGEGAEPVVVPGCEVWRLDLGGEAAGLDELIRGEAVVAGELRGVAAAGEWLLHRAWGATNRYSPYLGRARRCWGWVARLPRLMARLRQAPPAARERRAASATVRLSLTALLVRLLPRLLNKAWREALGRDLWLIGVRRAGGGGLPAGGGFLPIDNPRGSYLADPFLLHREGRDYLFCEEYRIAEAKGVIVAGELDGEGGLSALSTVLERPYHLSYPCLLEARGELWMVPESRRGGSVELYRCVEFPHRWALAATPLPGVAAVDSTLFEQDGRFWLFTSPVDPRSGAADDLELHWADRPEGPWHPHPANPLLSDARRGRCAGAVFLHDGELIRPAQDCAERYGRRLVFNRIERLSTEAYREVAMAELGGEWHPRGEGAHTWNRGGGWEVIDGALWRPRWRRGDG